jgi:bifunctional DNA-binding transcriptional regulator/antitoxin component of YhaV-PrlF toxin-antitoxin module
MAKSALKTKARVTRKRQIAVPREVQRAPGTRPGDKLHLEQDGSEFRGEPPRAESPIEKYRGIGNPTIPSGRKAVIRIIRQFRGR